MLGLFGKKQEKTMENAGIKKAEVLISEKKKSGGRKLQGIVVSDKMKKTIVVAVSQNKKHPKYQKYFTVTRRLKAHDENNEYRVGDKVMIQETRPLSKEKRWKVINKV